MTALLLGHCVPTLKPIFSLLSVENVPTLHTNKPLGWLFKGFRNSPLGWGRHWIFLLPTADTTQMPLTLLALVTSEQTAVENEGNGPSTNTSPE